MKSEQIQDTSDAESGVVTRSHSKPSKSTSVEPKKRIQSSKSKATEKLEESKLSLPKGKAAAKKSGIKTARTPSLEDTPISQRKEATLHTVPTTKPEGKNAPTASNVTSKYDLPVFGQADDEHTKRRQHLLGINQADSVNDAEFPFSPPRRISNFFVHHDTQTNGK